MKIKRGIFVNLLSQSPAKLLLSCVIMVGLTAMAGCSKIYNKTATNVDHTQEQMNHAKMVSEEEDPAVMIRQGYYVNTDPISVDTDPSWLKHRISLQARNMPLNLLMNRLLRDQRIVTSFDDTVQAQRPVNMNYVGTIKGALNTLGSELDYHYAIHDNAIDWSAFETKTFNISFMPGASNYLVGQQQNNAGSSASSSTPTSPIGQINDQQYSNLEGQLSIWQDIERTLSELKSSNGHFNVSESTTSVTVYDHPSNVRAIGKYIAQLNNDLSQQVAIKVQVLEVQLNKSFSYGIDWNAVVNGLGTRFNLTGSFATATNPTQNILQLTGATSAAGGMSIGQSNGAQTLMSVLSQQGKVRVVTEPEVVTLNNQIASIRITQNIGYVESISQSLSQNFLTTSITPGNITDGFTLYLLPKIQNDKIYMQITSTIATLERLDKVSTAANSNSTSTSQSTTNQQQFQAIQVPTLSQKAFNQRSVVTSGSTLIIAGYKRLRDEANQASLFGIDPLGGKGSQSTNIETLVLITPIILHSSKSHVHVNT